MTTQLPLNNMSLPPPALLQVDLLDGNRRFGWMRDQTIGFSGFASHTEAAHAAWVAYRRLARHLARRYGGRPAPIDVEPLTLKRDGDRETILASGRPFASLVRPGVDSPSGEDWFGFEIPVPLPPDELTMRGIAYRMYHTLRKSGIRWAMWERPRVTTAQRAAEPARSRVAPSNEDVGTIGWLALGVSSLVFLGLALVVPAKLAITLAAVGLAGLLAFRVNSTRAEWLPREVAPTLRWRSQRGWAERRALVPMPTDGLAATIAPPDIRGVAGITRLGGAWHDES